MKELERTLVVDNEKKQDKNSFFLNTGNVKVSSVVFERVRYLIPFVKVDSHFLEKHILIISSHQQRVKNIN